MQPIQLAKIAVIGLSLLIVIGLGVLVYGLTARGPDREAAAAHKPANAAPGALIPAFGEVRVALPEGCSVTEMLARDDRLYLRTGPAGQCERIVIIDTLTGRTLGTLLLRP